MTFHGVKRLERPVVVVVGLDYPNRLSKVHAPLWVKPSDAQVSGFKVHAVETVGNRIAVHPNTAFTLPGSALHNCIDCPTADPAQGMGLDEVKAILDR
jgi:hypothetical protein